jgi:hypothetical protein
MPLAYMLRFNDPASLNDCGMDPKDLQKVGFLIKTIGLKDELDPNNLMDLTNGYLSSGIPNRKLRDFATKIGGLDGGLIDGFLNYARMPRIKIIVHKDGDEQVSDEFKDLIDPFTGKIDQATADERRRQLELNSFKNQLAFMRAD